MDTIFSIDNNDDDSPFVEQINIDDLYEKKQKKDLKIISIYNKILKRIHTKIRMTSRNTNEQYVWFLVPEMLIGVTRYNNAECIAYLINQLRENGFNVSYTHPNLLLVSWAAWIPTYVREQLKSKIGITIDEHGQPVQKEKNSENPNSFILNKKNTLEHISTNKSSINKSSTNSKHISFKDIKTYKPSGNLVYDQELLQKIESKSK